MIKDIIVTYNYNSFILLENGDLWGCGKNRYGELGVGHDEQVNTFVKICENVEKIKCYFEKTFILKKDKTLWFAGSGSDLNLDEDGCITSFVKITNNVKDFSYLDSNGSFLFCLKNNGNLLELVEHKISLSNIKKITEEYKGKEVCLFIIKEDDSLFYFEEGVLNKDRIFNNVKNVFSDFNTPVFIQKTDDSLWKVKNSDFKRNIKILDDIKDVRILCREPLFSSFFLKKNGDLFVLGVNRRGELGTEQEKIYTPTLVAREVKEIYPFPAFSFILKNDNSLWGCGANYCNILGNKSKIYNFYSFKKICDDVKKVYSDEESLFIIKQNDELWISGKDAKYFQGDNYLRFMASDVKNVFLGAESFFISKKDNTLLCYGYNYYGQLGIGARESFLTKPVEYTAIKEHYSVKETIDVIKDVFKGKGL